MAILAFFQDKNGYFSNFNLVTLILIAKKTSFTPIVYKNLTDGKLTLLWLSFEIVRFSKFGNFSEISGLFKLEKIVQK